MDTKCKWNQVDNLNRPVYINSDDECYYAREHTDGGFSASDSNQIIFNYKKPIERKGFPDWIHKTQSITLFANELKELDFPKDSVLIPAPTSNPRGSADFDSRIEDSILELLKSRTDLQFQPILDIKQAVPSAHAGGGKRDPSDIKNNLIVNPFDLDYVPKRVFLIDDMITTGGHFRACKDKLLEKYPGLQVIGIFWAKHIFQINAV